MAEPSACRATRAAPMYSGAVPPSLLITTRSFAPPMLRRATWRMVCWLNWKGRPVGSTKSPPQIGWVLAIQLGLQ
jgi:hypothetical protein